MSAARRALAAAAIALLPVTLAGCGGAEPGSVADQARGGGRKGYIAGDGAIEQIPVADRATPVELSGTTLDGDDLDVGACTTARTNRTLLTADERDVGPRKILRPATSGSAPFNSDADVREFALAVADFAARYATAAASDDELTAEERRARAVLLSRQVTLR